VSANQMCGECGSPLRPCKCERDQGRKAPGNTTLRVRKRIKARSFSQTHDGKGERYGWLFRLVRRRACFLRVMGYRGLGHEGCGDGAQGGSTAHHVGRPDVEGLLPVCGRAHDLCAGLGGRTTVARFRAWLAEGGHTLKEMALRYVGEAPTQEEDNE